ncbi:MAG: hypothetical protein WBE92_09145 [Steroidobacteraceae bacterium]
MPLMKLLSRRVRVQLGALDNHMREVGVHRNTALRMFLVSRGVATAIAQREFWLEFFWLDQEYRAAVHTLAQFCSKHRQTCAPRSGTQQSRVRAVRLR